MTPKQLAWVLFYEKGVYRNMQVENWGVLYVDYDKEGNLKRIELDVFS
jgi:hypothetical protein